MWFAGVVMCFIGAEACGVQPLGLKDEQHFESKEKCEEVVQLGLSKLSAGAKARTALLEGQVTFTGGCIERDRPPTKMEFMRRYGPLLKSYKEEDA
jgi:hypothetical protein